MNARARTPPPRSHETAGNPFDLDDDAAYRRWRDAQAGATCRAAPTT